MSSSERKIAFKLELSRMLELLADQIYQSPLALLRENTQNAFDAIRMRQALGATFEPEIRVTVDDQNVVVTGQWYRDDGGGDRNAFLVRGKERQEYRRSQGGRCCGNVRHWSDGQLRCCR